MVTKEQKTLPFKTPYTLENYVRDLNEASSNFGNDYVIIFKEGQKNGRKVKISDISSQIDDELRLGDYTLKAVNVADPNQPPITTFVVERDSPTPFDEFSILEIKAPISRPTESTLALMRTVDPNSLGPEFVDIFNQGYNDSHAFGFRVQSRGSGSLLPFRFEYNNGQGVYTLHIMQPDGSFKHWIKAGTFDPSTGWFTPSAGQNLVMELDEKGLLFNLQDPVLTKRNVLSDGKLYGVYADKTEAIADGRVVGDMWVRSDGMVLVITDMNEQNEP